MRRFILCTALLFAGGLLAGCGNKGPLVLPTQPASTSTTAKPAAPALPATVNDPATDQY